jgi:hypothetical protein
MRTKQVGQISSAAADKTRVAVAGAFTIPADVLVDVLYALHHNALDYEISDVFYEERSVRITMAGPTSAKTTAAVENIHHILNEYEGFLKGAPLGSLLYE